MTGVPQLPVEAASAKAPSKGETPRIRANKPSEEGAESGFAAVLAQALPDSAQAAKAALAIALKSFEVEGEGIPAETAVVAAAGETEQQASAVKAAAPSTVLEAPLQQLPAAAAPEKGLQLVAMTETQRDQPVADIVEDVAVVEQWPEAQPVEVDEAALQQTPSQSSEKASQIRELTAPQEEAPKKVQQDERTAEPPQASRPRPAPVKLTAVAAIAVDPSLVTHAAVAQPDHAPPEKSTAPEKQEAPPVPRAESAVEAKRLVETPSAANAASRPTNEAPVIEFQVRRPPQNTRLTPLQFDSVGATTSKAPEVQPKTAPQLEQAPPTTEAAVRVAMRTVKEAIEPAAAKPTMPTPSRVAVPQAVEATPHGDLGQNDDQARRDESNGPPDSRKEPVESPTSNVKSLPVSPAAEPEAPTEAPQQGPFKPVLAAQSAAASTTAPQITAQANMPAETSPARPPEEPAPLAAAKPPSEPEIAVKLQQQSGRTTLNVVLQDERLGRVALQLVERGGWIETAIRASDPRTAQTLSNSAAGLFEALQQRGLALTTGGGAAAWDAQEGRRGDNPQRDQESQSRRFRLRRNAGEFEGALARAEV